MSEWKTEKVPDTPIPDELRTVSVALTMPNSCPECGESINAIQQGEMYTLREAGRVQAHADPCGHLVELVAPPSDDTPTDPQLR